MSSIETRRIAHPLVWRAIALSRLWHLAVGLIIGVSALGFIITAAAESSEEEAIAESPREFVAISVSDTHACAITSGSELICWGSNEDGQLNLPEGEYSSVATARDYTCAISTDGVLTCSGLLTLSDENEHPWVSVHASIQFACAVNSEGAGACWPRDTGLHDDTGQLDVPADQQFREIAGTTNTLACGITTSDTIVCWGSWTGRAIPGSIPLDIPDGSFTDIAMGTIHACAVRTSGDLHCWGANPYGQTDAPSGRFTTVSAGWAHSCGLMTDGEMVCWGHDGNYDELFSYPHGSYRALDVGFSTTCAITQEGEAVCWGYNGVGQADAPDGRFIGDPVLASDESLHAVDIAGTHSSSCALLDDGQVVCWGAYEQAEDGVGSPRPRHSNRPWSAKPADERFASISTGWSHSCGLTGEGVVHCWGFNDHGQLDAPEGEYQSVSASLYYTCGLRTDGQIRCWCQNDYSGYGATTPPATEGSTGQADPPQGTFEAMSAGWEHACALDADGEIVCWGRNHNGQADPPDGAYEAMSAGWDYSCALTESGSIACWGLGPESAPAAKYQSVSAGWGYACGLTTGNQLQCWGADNLGQASPPAGDFVAVKTGKVHSCGVRTDASVACWGYGFYGQTNVPTDLRSGRRSGVIEVSQLDDGTVSGTFVPNESFERTTDDADLVLLADATAGVWQQSDQVVVEGEAWGTIAARWTDDERVEISFIEIDGQRLLPGGRHFTPTSAVEAIAIAADNSGWPTLNVTESAATHQSWQSSVVPIEHVEVQVPDYNEPTFTFWGEVTDETQERLRDRARKVQAHFYRKYRAIPSDLEVHYAADYDSGEDAIEEVTRRRSRFEGCGQILAPRVMYMNSICSSEFDSIDWGTFDHEYFHNLQIAGTIDGGATEEQWTDYFAAIWFLEGGASYAASEHKWTLGYQPYQLLRNHWINTGGQAEVALEEMEYARPSPAGMYGMGFLAVELLIQQAGIDVLLEVNRLMPQSDTWDDAFEQAVGMTTDEFYTLFAEWLPQQNLQSQQSRASAPSRPAGGFNFLGEVSTERQQEIRNRYLAIQTHFEEQYAVAPLPAPINIAATLEDLRSLFEAEGRELPSHAPCYWGVAGYVLVEGCEDPLPLERLYMSVHLLSRAGGSSVVVEDGHLRAGPVWLYHGMENYGEAEYRDAADEESISDVRTRLRRGANRQTNLSDIETRSTFYAARGHDIAWLAINWLVQQAGADSYVDYLLKRPEYATWQETFEAAFGLTVADFYERFDAFQSRGFR